MMRYIGKNILLVAAATLLAACSPPEQKAQKYYEQGMQFIAQHQDDKAHKALLESVKFKNDKIETWRALADIDKRAKATRSLFQDLRRIVELDANDRDSRVELARMMVEGGAADAALKLIDPIDDGAKPNAALHVVRMLALARKNSLADARKEAERTRQIDPANVEATLLLVAGGYADIDAQAALKLLDTLPADKADTRVALAKTQAYLRINQPAQAETILRKLVADDPKNPVFRNDLVRVLIATKHSDEAEKVLRAAVAADSANSKLGLELVRFLAATHGALAGRDELNARIAKGGDVFDYQMALVDSESAGGHGPEAIDLLKKLGQGADTPAHKTEAQLKLAATYVVKADFASAEPIIAEVLKKDGRNGTALRLRAAISMAHGQYDSAIADLRTALNDQPKSVELLVALATVYEVSGKSELAAQQYESAVQASAQSPAVVQLYVTFLMKRNDAAHAEDVTASALARNPNHPQLLLLLAESRLSRRNWSGALAAADALAKASPNAAEAYQIRAAVYAGQKRYDESIAALEAAHAALPNALLPVTNLVPFYLRQGKIDKADALVHDFVKKYPDNAQILVLLGLTQLAQKKPNEAEQSFKTVIDKQPKDATGYSALVDFYARQKNFAAAIQTLKQAIENIPGNTTLRFRLAEFDIVTGDTGAAIAQYESILKNQPNAPLAINNLVSLTLDSPSSSKEQIDRAMSLAERLKDSPEAHLQDTYGWSQFKRGDAQGAIATLEAVRAKLGASTSVAIHYHLGMSYLSNGDKGKATSEFKEAARLQPDGTPLKKEILDAIKRSQ
ncbi:MAG: tetratricopeptide repeat protein [Burkholderiaceae bacterium]|jgi:predicted Zn-dependent protease|nr:tetratricopeptide repeat protein [Burkholderiaceae bacterium]